MALGKIYSVVWVEKPWFMPAIRCYMGLLHHFENLIEQTNVYLVTKMAEVLTTAKTDSVQAIAQRFEAIVDPLAKTFTTVESVFNYFKASLQYKVIRHRAKAKGSKARAWHKAYDFLKEEVALGHYSPLT